MRCVAEGIETEDVADLLEQLGVTTLQGNLFARAMPADAVPSWMELWTRQGSSPALTVTESEGGLLPEISHRGQSSDPIAPAGTKDPNVPVHRLPPRQFQVMQLVGEGRTVKEIARSLGLSAGTVKVHLALAYSALGARNRIEAIRRLGAGDLPPMDDIIVPKKVA
jgi:DNA-binding CsgD family transcriptional regulator